MKVTVVGYGSIGSRHARILAELGHQVSIVSRREVSLFSHYYDLAHAVSAGDSDYMVIANTTKEHYSSVQELANVGFKGKVLIEKPLFHAVREFPSNLFQDTFVAYNLRFHPLIQQLQRFLQGEKIVSVQAYVGQYLPDWRPQTDYRICYSANKGNGGGVLRDLSHELDYITWVLGGWESVVAIGGHFSNLEIDSDDTYSILLTTPRCQTVSIQMNYLDRMGRRQIIVNTMEHTIELDLILGRLVIDKREEYYQIDRDFTYRLQHESILSGNRVIACSLQQGLDVLELIDAIELSSKNREWVKR